MIAVAEKRIITDCAAYVVRTLKDASGGTYESHITKHQGQVVELVEGTRMLHDTGHRKATPDEAKLYDHLLNEQAYGEAQAGAEVTKRIAEAERRGQAVLESSDQPDLADDEDGEPYLRVSPGAGGPASDPVAVNAALAEAHERAAQIASPSDPKRPGSKRG